MEVKLIRAGIMVGLASALPLIELYFALAAYHKRGLYADSGFMIALGMAFFALCLLYRGIGDLRLNKRMLVANLVLMAAAIGARIPFYKHGPVVEVEWMGALWTLLVGTGLCVFAEPKRVFSHFRAHRPILYLLGAVYIVQALYYMMRYVIWFNREVWYGFLANKVTATVRYLLEVMQYELFPARRVHEIETAELKIWINGACSGMEGVVFFCCVFAAMMMLDYKSIPVKKIAVGFLTGIVMMLTLNIIRITVFFMFGVWAARKWGGAEGIQLTTELFHNNVGWILYSIGMVVFFMWFYRYADKKPNITPVDNRA